MISEELSIHYELFGDLTNVIYHFQKTLKLLQRTCGEFQDIFVRNFSLGIPHSNWPFSSYLPLFLEKGSSSVYI